MERYTQRVRENILPLSVASTLPEAFKEWSFFDETHDHEEPIETCGLCNQEGLRYHFRIKNALTQKQLWVGSHCILRFELSVFEGGIVLSAAGAKQKLEKLAEKMRLDFCLKSLALLAKNDGGNTGMLQGALEYYRLNKVLTTKKVKNLTWLGIH